MAFVVVDCNRLLALLRSADVFTLFRANSPSRSAVTSSPCANELLPLAVALSPYAKLFVPLATEPVPPEREFAPEAVLPSPVALELEPLFD